MSYIGSPSLLIEFLASVRQHPNQPRSPCALVSKIYLYTSFWDTFNYFPFLYIYKIVLPPHDDDGEPNNSESRSGDVVCGYLDYLGLGKRVDYIVNVLNAPSIRLDQLNWVSSKSQGNSIPMTSLF